MLRLRDRLRRSSRTESYPILPSAGTLCPFPSRGVACGSHHWTSARLPRHLAHSSGSDRQGSRAATGANPTDGMGTNLTSRLSRPTGQNADVGQHRSRRTPRPTAEEPQISLRKAKTGVRLVSEEVRASCSPFLVGVPDGAVSGVRQKASHGPWSRWRGGSTRPRHPCRPHRRWPRERCRCGTGRPRSRCAQRPRRRVPAPPRRLAPGRRRTGPDLR